MQCKDYFSKHLQKVSADSVKREHVVLSSLLYAALKLRSPMRDIEAPKVKKYQAYVISDKEFKLFHQTVKGTVDEIILLLTAWNGFRPSKTFALKRDDILFQEELIRVDEGEKISVDGYIIGSPKSENSYRKIITSPYLMDLLKKYVLNNMEKVKIFDYNPNAYSKRFKKIIKIHNKALKYQQEKGMPLSTKGLAENAILRNIHIQPEPLPDVRFYDMRHYQAVLLYKAGIPGLYAAERMGHDVAVLKAKYQHIQQEEKKEIDNKIRIMFGNNKPEKTRKKREKIK